MKFLVVLMFCSSCLLASCAGLKCYRASNLDFYLFNLTIEECISDFSDVCATSTSRNGEVSYRTCGDEEFCTAKGCIDSRFCTKPGTYEHGYPGHQNVKFTITCCDADLCNVESSAKTLNRICFNSLFYMCVLVYFYLTSL